MRKWNISACFFLSVLLTILGTGPVFAQGEDDLVAKSDFFLPKVEAQPSADGLAVTNAVPPLVLVADPNPQLQGLRTAGPTADQLLAAPEAAISTFSITYVAAGEQDPWGQPCTAFPDSAKAAFQAAAAIWQNRVRSSVPITIRACWADLGSSSILGYSGGQPIHRNFSGAPKANTWYEQSLANALAGSRLRPDFDMHITYNSQFSWYMGTDGNTPYGKFDLVTVAAHEIAHGLNFSGSAQYSGGTGSYGIGGYPLVYDTFLQSGAGTPLTSYSTPSSALGTLLTSGNLWFSGANANARNGGSRVRIYAPGSWSSGSSYAHLDHATYAGGINRMMVYAVAPASSTHDPGPVSMGLLQDMGWSTSVGFSMSGMVRQGSATGAPLAGATVAIAGRTTSTSSTGTFSITGIPAGSYTLTISKSGFVTKTVTGYPVSGNQSGLNFFLNLGTVYSLSGTVHSGSATGPMLAGATVAIAGKTALSTSTGTFSIAGIPAGSYSLVISKAGYYTKTITGVVVNANRSGMALYLTQLPIYSISGTVRSGSTAGPVLAGATVAIAGRAAITSSAGTFSIVGIPLGTYSLVISRPGYYTKTMTGVVINATRSGMQLYLTPIPLYSISGTVRLGSTTGPVVAGATLTVAGKTAITGSTGSFGITGIPGGTHTVTISKAGYLTRSTTVTLPPSRTGLVFYLTPSYTVSGTVRNGSATGMVLPGATVAIAGKTALTSSTGGFSIAAIPAGSYTLTISKTGYQTKIVTGFLVNSNRTGLNFYLTASGGYSLSGTVRNGSGTGPVVPGATVSIAGKVATTSSTGSFSITGIPAGVYTLTISKSGYLTKTITYFTMNGSRSGLTLILATTTGSMKVINGTSLSITQLYVSPSLSSSWGSNKLASPLPPGWYALGTLNPDNYDVKAVLSNGVTATGARFPVLPGYLTTLTITSGANGAVQLLQTPQTGAMSGEKQMQMQMNGGGNGGPKP